MHTYQAVELPMYEVSAAPLRKQQTPIHGKVGEECDGTTAVQEYRRVWNAEIARVLCLFCVSMYLIKTIIIWVMKYDLKNKYL